MTKEEEIAFAQAEYTKGNKGPLEILIKENIPLARSLSKNFYQSINQDKEDIDMIATQGLLNALLQFDTSKNIKFSTFAVTVIKNELIREVRKTQTDKRKLHNECLVHLDSLIDNSDKDSSSLYNFVADKTQDVEGAVINNIINQNLESKLIKFLSPNEKMFLSYLQEKITKEELEKHINSTSIRQLLYKFRRKLEAINHYRKSFSGKKHIPKYQLTEETIFGKEMAAYIFFNKQPSSDFIIKYGNLQTINSLIKKAIKNLDIKDRQRQKIYYLKYILNPSEFELAYKLQNTNKKPTALAFDFNMSTAKFEELTKKTAKKLTIALRLYKTYYSTNLSKEEICEKFDLPQNQANKYIRFVSYLKTGSQSKLKNLIFSYPVDLQKPATYQKVIKQVYHNRIFNNPEKLKTLKPFFKNDSYQILKLYCFENKSLKKILKTLNLNKPQLNGRLRAVKIKLSQIYNIYDMVNRGQDIKDIATFYKMQQNTLLKQYTAGTILFEDNPTLPLVYTKERNDKIEQQKKFINSLPISNCPTFEEKIMKVCSIFSKSNWDPLHKLITNEQLSTEENIKLNKLIIKLRKIYFVYNNKNKEKNDNLTLQNIKTIKGSKISNLLQLGEYLFSENKTLDKSYILHISSPEDNAKLHKQNLINIWKGFDITKEGVYQRMKNIVTKETFDMFKFKYVDNKRYFEHKEGNKSLGRVYQKKNDFFINIMNNMSFCYFNYLEHGENWIATNLGIRPEWAVTYFTRAKHLLTGEKLENEQEKGLLRIKQYFSPDKSEKQILKEIACSTTDYEYSFFYLYFVKQYDKEKLKEIFFAKFGEKSEKTMQNLPRVITAKIKKCCYERDKKHDVIITK